MFKLIDNPGIIEDFFPRKQCFFVFKKVNAIFKGIRID